MTFFCFINLSGEAQAPWGPLDTRLRGSEAGVYTHFTPSPLPPNKNEKLHNLDFSTFSKIMNSEKITGHTVILTIFDCNLVTPYEMFNANCVQLCSIHRKKM